MIKNEVHTMYAEIRNNYTWGPAVESGSVPSECGDLLAAVTIDGWRTGCDAEQGAVIAMVILTKHGDIVTDFHDNGARMDTEVLSAIKGAKETLKGIWIDEKKHKRRLPKGSGNSVTYQKVLYVPGSVLQTIRGYLQAQSKAEYQGEDNTIIYTAKFPDRKEMDIKCCGCRDESSWTEAVLFDENGFQLTYSEVEEEFEGPWELEYNGVHYCADVRPDTADSK